jgi:hypothetical protein
MLSASGNGAEPTQATGDAEALALPMRYKMTQGRKYHKNEDLMRD